MEKNQVIEIFDEVLDKWFAAESGYEHLPDGAYEDLEKEKETLRLKFIKALNIQPYSSE